MQAISPSFSLALALLFRLIFISLMLFIFHFIFFLNVLTIIIKNHFYFFFSRSFLVLYRFGLARFHAVVDRPLHTHTHTHSDRPIAIAYSPTEPNPSHLADVYRPTPAHHSHHSTPVFVNAVPANHHNHNTNNHINDDSNLNANQQFQAPFIPSINLENTQSTHNGWLIVTPPSVVAGSSNVDSKSNRISASLVNANATSSISRSDSDETAESVASVENTTRKFDFDNFRPDFQSGFVPIYKASTIPPAAVTSTTERSEPTAQTRADNDKSDHSEISLESLIYDDEEI